MYPPKFLSKRTCMSQLQPKANAIPLVGRFWRLIQPFWPLFSTAIGAATLISVAKSIFDIELLGLPAKMLDTYVWLRETLFLPVVWILDFLDVRIPPRVKDLIILYGVIAAAHWRMLGAGIAKDLPTRILGFYPHGLSEARKHANTILWIALWPLFDLVLWHRNLKLQSFPTRVQHTGYTNTDAYKREVDYYRILLQAPEYDKLTYPNDKTTAQESFSLFTKKVRSVVLLNLLAIVVCAVIFFLYSYLANKFGPPL